MATYTQIVDKILDWSNRDTEVLPYTVIKDCINYGVDEAYRDLRIAPLEQTITYDRITATQAANGLNTLAVPSDLIEFIQLRKEDSNSLTDYVVYDSRPDIRSFYDEELIKYKYYYFTRQQNNLILYPAFADSDLYQLYYYRRLPETDARYTVNGANNTSGLLYFDSDSQASLVTAVNTAEPNAFSRDKDLMSRIVTNPTGLKAGFYLGRLTPNWLRDENEKVILFGALTQAFDYLNEMDTAQKFRDKFVNEINTLNKEDLMRMYSKSGGIHTHFTAYGQI